MDITGLKYLKVNSCGNKNVKSSVQKQPVGIL